MTMVLVRSSRHRPDGKAQRMTGNTGRLYRISASGEVTKLTDDIFSITNTMVWTRDGRFVTADTLANQLFVYDVTTRTSLGTRRPFTRTIDLGLPDGSTSDASGVVFNARVAGGAALARIDTAAERVDFLPLPCRSPTSCCFGGRNLDILYVTSARFGLAPADLDDNSADGGLFAFAGVGRGLESARFG